jgi:hypothetical protein
VNEPITSKEQFAGVALLKIGRAKTVAELSTLYGDCQLAFRHGDVASGEYDTLVTAIERRDPVVRLLDAVRDAKDGDQLTAAARAAREQRAAEKLTSAQFDEVCRAGAKRRGELKGEQQ